MSIYEQLGKLRFFAKWSRWAYNEDIIYISNDSMGNLENPATWKPEAKENTEYTAEKNAVISEAKSEE